MKLRAEKSSRSPRWRRRSASDLRNSPVADLAQIIEFISRDNVEAALRVARELLARTRTIAEHPRIGRILPEFQLETLRELAHGNYRIVYEIDDAKKQIAVARFWHGARGTPTIRG
jgi:toxin ParE1/3/4